LRFWLRLPVACRSRCALRPVACPRRDARHPSADDDAVTVRAAARAGFGFDVGMTRSRHRAWGGNGDGFSITQHVSRRTGRWSTQSVKGILTAQPVRVMLTDGGPPTMAVPPQSACRYCGERPKAWGPRDRINSGNLLRENPWLQLHRTWRVYNDLQRCTTHSGNPAFRRPSISSFACACLRRPIHADIVRAGSTSSTRAAASRASASRPRWA
jgi:hypothetical protein